MPKKCIIVFSPHPDDETLGVGGTIAKKAMRGYEVFIVLMTDGRNAFKTIFRIGTDPTPEELKVMRKKELERALVILGVKPKDNLICLDFEDGLLAESESSAEDKVKKLLVEKAPTEVYFTYSKDTNPDHRATNRIVQNAIRNSGVVTTRYQYSIKQGYSRVGPVADNFLNFFLRRKIRVEISEFVDLKRAALDEFKSQTTVLSSHQPNPILSASRIDCHLRNYEVFYED